MRVATLSELVAVLAPLDRSVAFPPEGMRVKRGKSGGTQRVVLPEGFLDDPDDATPPSPEAETAADGG